MPRKKLNKVRLNLWVEYGTKAAIQAMQREHGCTKGEAVDCLAAFRYEEIQKALEFTKKHFSNTPVDRAGGPTDS